MNYNLKGPNVYLAPLTKDDIPLLVAWRNQVGLKRLTGMSPFVPLQEDEFDISSHMLHKVQFGIRKSSDKLLLGWVGLVDIAWTILAAELSIYLGNRDQFGRGYGTEAIHLILDYGFNELNLHRIQLEVVDYNQRAINTYKKIGFTQEGALREMGYRDGKRYDKLIFGLLRHEWTPAKL